MIQEPRTFAGRQKNVTAHRSAETASSLGDVARGTLFCQLAEQFDRQQSLLSP